MEKKKIKISTIFIVGSLVLLFIILIVKAMVIIEGVSLGKREWKIKEKEQQESIIIVDELNKEEQSIINKYKTIEYLDIIYTSQNIKISDDKIGTKIGTVTKNAGLKINIFKVINFSEECVIAVQFSDTLDYYVYVNVRYKPETLEELINDFNLKESLSFKKIYYNYDYIDLKLNKQTEKIEFYDINKEEIWKALFDEMNLKNVSNNPKAYNQEYLSQYMNISISISVLGLEDWIAFSLSDNGYLLTYIFESVDAYYIGKNKVKNFMDYIVENYDGYKSNVR